jgi:hypothetical protein
MPGKPPELTAAARSAMRTAPAAAYHHRPRLRRRLLSPAPAAAPFATDAGSEDIDAPGAEASRSEIWNGSKEFSAPCSNGGLVLTLEAERQRSERWNVTVMQGVFNTPRCGFIRETIKTRATLSQSVLGDIFLEVLYIINAWT